MNIGIITISQELFFRIGVIGLIIYSFWRYGGRASKQMDWMSLRVKILFQLYVLLLVSVVFFPIQLQFGDYHVYRGPIVWVNPVTSFFAVAQQGLWASIKNFGGNAILLTPMVFFALLYYENLFKNVYRVIGFAFLVSLSIESLQYIESLLIPGVQRYSEINDLILNTFSGWLGYKLYYFLKKAG